MAQLPSEKYLIQQIPDGSVILFNRYTEEVLLSFAPSDPDNAAKAQSLIHHNDQLSAEDKCFAHFWSGYFYAHATAQGEISFTIES